MYAEEYLAEEEIEISEYSSDISSDMDSQAKYRSKMLKKYKLTNPDYYSYKKVVNGEEVKIECYSTPILSNAFIRHAISGVKCPHRSGTRYEDLYFRVMDTTSGDGMGPKRLYYYSPEEYERHQFVSLPQSLKEDWLIHNMRANKIYNS
jgi:hypothetical protein